jgi:hypothetical protein
VTVSPQNTGVGFVFVVMSLLYFPWRSLVIFGRVFSIVVLVHFYLCSFYRCGARNFHRSNLPGHIPSLLRSLYSFLRFILTDPLTESTLSLHHKTRSRSSKHRRGESEWIRLRLMDSPTFLSTSHSAFFGDLHASTSAQCTS